MATILEKIVDDLNELYDDFDEIDTNNNGEAVIYLKRGESVEKGDVDENSKTYQILEIYEQVV